MKIIFNLSGALLLLALAFTAIGHSPNKEEDTFTSLVKVALRNTGNTLLLQSKDSTSLVLPVVELTKNKFQLSFQTELSITPDSLVSSVNKNFNAMGLPEDYIVEVIDCSNKAVSYSYSISNNEERSIIPCKGRTLPLNCYTINVLFNDHSSFTGMSFGTSWYSLVLLGMLGIWIFYWAKNRKLPKTNYAHSFETIGEYKFYKDQNELVKDGQNIKLTSKESELLKIFSDNQNKVVKRDFLLKEVWENKGVFVGRSLDTFISKIRKKFKDDNHINLLNVHGVGYKLEIIKKSRK